MVHPHQNNMGIETKWRQTSSSNPTRKHQSTGRYFYRAPPHSSIALWSK